MTSQTDSQTPRVGVYICHCGGNISDHVDVEAVAEAAARMPHVSVSRRNLFMCSDPGQELIMEDIREGLIDRVVVASCSPSLHETTFRRALMRAGLNPYLYLHVNIREQVSWVAEGAPATEKSIALVAAAVAKVSLVAPLEPIRVEALDHCTVVGGGPAGLKCAWDLALRGSQVTLVEKTPFLGGWLGKLDRLFPTGEKAADLLGYLAQRVLRSPEITVLTSAQVTAQEGYIGNFKLTIERRPPEDPALLESLAFARAQGAPGEMVVPGLGVLPQPAPPALETIHLTTGTVVMATGFTNYRPQVGEFGYAEMPEVLTLAEFIRLRAQADRPGRYLEINGRKIRSLAMVHCVGSRQVPGVHQPDAEGRLYQHCSRTCCNALLYNALQVRLDHPGTVVYDFYRDIRAYGRFHEEVYQMASANQVRFLRFAAGREPLIARSSEPGYALEATVTDTLSLDEELVVPLDLVVLGTGMRPGEIRDLVEVMKCQTGPDGFLQEVHPKIRPVEIATAGIYLAGTCQAPMDVGEATAAASASAAKVSAVLSAGMVELEPFVAQVDRTKCKACLTCVRTCPFGVPHIQNGRAFIEPASCYGCGQCAGQCPAGAINLAHFKDNEILAAVRQAVQPEILPAQPIVVPGEADGAGLEQGLGGGEAA